MIQNMTSTLPNPREKQCKSVFPEMVPLKYQVIKIPNIAQIIAMLPS